MIGTRTGQRRRRAVEESCAGPSPGRDSTPRIPRVEDVSRRRNDATREKGHAMAYHLISFPSVAMDQIREEEMPDVARAAHAACQEAISAGVTVDMMRGS